VVEIGYRQAQQDFAAGFADSLSVLPVDTWWEDWMRQADRLLDDPELVQIVHRAMLQRCPKSLTRGRLSTPAEVVLRLLVLKHLRNWSYAVLAREVRANLVYRQFTRIGLQTVPHPKTMGKLGLLLGPEVVQQLHRGLVARAQAEKVIRGRKMRVDTTVTETNIHYRMSRVKLVYSAGVSPARAKVRGPVAWIVRRKETESRESIDKAILGMVSESSGRNESKRTGGPENVNPGGRALGNGVKAAWNVATWPMRRYTLAG
jgi:IS5 family transposase